MSAEFSERPHPERDLSRATWQRSIGAVVMRELTEQAFQEIPELTEVQLEICESNAHPKSSAMGLSWARAYYLAEPLLRARTDHIYRETETAPYWLRQQFWKYTFAKDINNVMTEGMSTMAAFPLSLARSITETVEDTLVSDTKKSGLEANSLEDIATMLRQPYLRNMIETSLLTSNGFWKGFSTEKKAALPEALHEMNIYIFHDDGTVSFNSEAVSAMREAIRFVNTDGFSHPHPVMEQSSSGCPARHLRPSFNSAQDMVYLEMLSEYFEKTPEQLTEKREQNVVQMGLDFVAAGLEQYSDWFAQRDDKYREGHKLPTRPYIRQAFPTKLPSPSLKA